MKKKEIRRRLNEFAETKKSLIDFRADFTVTETNYTKNLKTGKQRVFFSDDKKDFLELKLMNLTKRDAKKYCEENQLDKITESQIDWYKYTENANSIFKRNSINGYLEVYKLDLSGAYWVQAINLGVLSKETIDFFNDNKDKFINGAKQARLKALGSCATRKLISEYKNGRLVGNPRLSFDEVLRNLYLNICRDVDNVMKSICLKFHKNTIYYYWDCVFIDVSDIDINEVVNFTLECGFKSKFETSVVKVNKDYQPNLKDFEKNIQYPIKKDELNKQV